MRLILSLIFLSISCVAVAEEISAFERSLRDREDVFTKESIVEMKGHKFRRIDYDGKTVYLQLLQEDATTNDLTYLCGDASADQFVGGKVAPASPALVKVGVHVQKRTRLFVEGLRTLCAGSFTRPHAVLDPALRIGFMLEDDPNSKSLIKNKTLYITPGAGLPGLGFQGEW